jgi:hypothetical protein
LLRCGGLSPNQTRIPKLKNMEIPVLAATIISSLVCAIRVYAVENVKMNFACPRSEHR